MVGQSFYIRSDMHAFKYHTKHETKKSESYIWRTNTLLESLPIFFKKAVEFFWVCLELSFPIMCGVNLRWGIRDPQIRKKCGLRIQSANPHPFLTFEGKSAILKSAKCADCGFNPQIRKAHLRIPQHRLKCCWDWRWVVLLVVELITSGVGTFN